MTYVLKTPKEQIKESLIAAENSVREKHEYIINSSERWDSITMNIEYEKLRRLKSRIKFLKRMLR